MVYCVATNSQNGSASGGGVSFYTFRTDPSRRKAWTNQINRAHWAPTFHSRLCSDHFEDSCFVLAASIGFQPKQRRLKPDAVPTVFKRALSTEETRVVKKRRGAYEKRRHREVSTHCRPTGVGQTMLAGFPDMTSHDHGHGMCLIRVI